MDVLDWLKKIGSSCPVVVMSGSTDDVSKASDAVAFLAKPLKLDLLLTLVRKLAA